MSFLSFGSDTPARRRRTRFGGKTGNTKSTTKEAGRRLIDYDKITIIIYVQLELTRVRRICRYAVQSATSDWR